MNFLKNQFVHSALAVTTALTALNSDAMAQIKPQRTAQQDSLLHVALNIGFSMAEKDTVENLLHQRAILMLNQYQTADTVRYRQVYRDDSTKLGISMLAAGGRLIARVIDLEQPKHVKKVTYDVAKSGAVAEMQISCTKPFNDSLMREDKFSYAVKPSTGLTPVSGHMSIGQNQSRRVISNWSPRNDADNLAQVTYVEAKKDTLRYVNLTQYGSNVVDYAHGSVTSTKLGRNIAVYDGFVQTVKNMIGPDGYEAFKDFIQPLKAKFN